MEESLKSKDALKYFLPKYEIVGYVSKRLGDGPRRHVSVTCTNLRTAYHHYLLLRGTLLLIFKVEEYPNGLELLKNTWIQSLQRTREGANLDKLVQHISRLPNVANPKKYLTTQCYD